MHITMKKVAMNLKGSWEEYMGGLEGRKEWGNIM